MKSMLKRYKKGSLIVETKIEIEKMIMSLGSKTKSKLIDEVYLVETVIQGNLYVYAIRPNQKGTVAIYVSNKKENALIAYLMDEEKMVQYETEKYVIQSGEAIQREVLKLKKNLKEKKMRALFTEKAHPFLGRIRKGLELIKCTHREEELLTKLMVEAGVENMDELELHLKDFKIWYNEEGKDDGTVTIRKEHIKYLIKP